MPGASIERTPGAARVCLAAHRSLGSRQAASPDDRKERFPLASGLCVAHRGERCVAHVQYIHFAPAVHCTLAGQHSNACRTSAHARAAVLGSQASIFGLTVLYERYAPRVPEIFSVHCWEGRRGGVRGRVDSRARGRTCFQGGDKFWITGSSVGGSARICCSHECHSGGTCELSS